MLIILEYLTCYFCKYILNDISIGTSYSSRDPSLPPNQTLPNVMIYITPVRLKSSLLASFFSLFTVLFVSQLSIANDLNLSWDKQLEKAKGQTVYFNAWGGDDRINRYLLWAAKRIKKEYGVTLKHVKTGDIAEVVGQLEAAKTVGRHTDGNVDLMWVNGENFATMKRNHLMWGAFANTLPNRKFVKDSSSIMMDFSVPVDGLESPWGRAQLVFFNDAKRLPQPPKSTKALLAFVKTGGRFAYPAPPSFHGTTMVKQFLYDLTEQRDALAQPVNPATFDEVTAPLWRFLDELHPVLWGRGKSWPSSAEQTRQMLDDGELDIALSFNPNEASAAVKSGQLAETVRTFVFEGGTIGNTHFVTIPYNAKAKAGAMVVANFLLSAEAQAYKASPDVWGDLTVLDMQKLNDADKKQFTAIELGPWALPANSSKSLPEPHASWAGALEEAWLKRYSK